MVVSGRTVLGSRLVFRLHDRSGAAATGTSTLSDTLSFCSDVAVNLIPKGSIAGTSPSSTTAMVRNEEPPCATFLTGVGVDHETLPEAGEGSSAAVKL